MGLPKAPAVMRLPRAARTRACAARTRGYRAVTESRTARSVSGGGCEPCARADIAVAPDATVSATAKYRLRRCRTSLRTELQTSPACGYFILRSVGERFGCGRVRLKRLRPRSANRIAGARSNTAELEAAINPWGILHGRNRSPVMRNHRQHAIAGGDRSIPHLARIRLQSENATERPTPADVLVLDRILS